MAAHGKVLLLPRPRRFGKTLNLTMLEAFFDHQQDASLLFQDLAISRDAAAMQHLNQYPTLYLTLKDTAFATWSECEVDIKARISADVTGQAVVLHADKFARRQDLSSGEHAEAQFFGAGNSELEPSRQRKANKRPTDFEPEKLALAGKIQLLQEMKGDPVLPLATLSELGMEVLEAIHKGLKP